MRPITWSIMCSFTLIYLSCVSLAKPPFLVAELMRKLDKGLRLASDFMAKTSTTRPEGFGEGGGCYTSYGTLRPQDCQAALALMPSENISPDDVRDTAAGPEVMRAFERSNPLAWKYNNCVIGVGVRHTARTMGLYPPLKDCASMIVNRCVTRAQGGIVRFGYFEVVVFDDTLLPRTVPDYIFHFVSDPRNIPWSRGLERLWFEKLWAERAETARARRYTISCILCLSNNKLMNFRARNASTSFDTAISALLHNQSRPS